MRWGLTPRRRGKRPSGCTLRCGSFDRGSELMQLRLKLADPRLKRFEGVALVLAHDLHVCGEVRLSSRCCTFDPPPRSGLSQSLSLVFSRLAPTTATPPSMKSITAAVAGIVVSEPVRASDVPRTWT